MNKKIILVLFIMAVILLPAVISNVNASHPKEYKLMDKNTPSTILVTGSATEALITGITATENSVSGMFLDEFGNPHRYMTVYYTVSYDDLRPKEIYFEEIIIPYEPIEVLLNNDIKKTYIEAHAFNRWGWNMTPREYGYNKITPGNQ